MKITKLMAEKAKDNMNNSGVTIAFLGASGTQGCFELYKKSETEYETVFDKNCAFHAYVARIFAVLYPTVPVNIINAGISGDRAPHAYERLERDVLRYNPDLVVLSIGLNDSGAGINGINEYKEALSKIFKRLNKENIETIFMTPNMANTYVSYSIKDKDIREVAEIMKKIQTEGVFDLYMDAAREACEENNVVVCDNYKMWKRLYENGVDTTELLSNKINHPTREMNWMPAMLLVDQMFK